MLLRSLPALTALILMTIPQGASSEPLAPREASAAALDLCFAPGTSPELVGKYAERRAWASSAHSLSASSGTKHQLGSRWSSTATDGPGLGQGMPTTLTWSIVPDGTSIYGSIGEPTADSNLRAFLNGIYGNEATWLAVFQQVFDRWGELTGIRYVYEPNDDGDPWTGGLYGTEIAGGQLGVRGDIRIAGHPLDGNYGVLAYNFYPNSGDMVLDTSDSFFSSTGSNSLGLRNTLAHEHGHGLGLRHVCPVNQTKLMEPFISFAFDGPQHDDILGANRAYGDAAEDNDVMGTPTHLGTLDTPATLTNRSIDDNSDFDVYSFSVGNGAQLSVTLTPRGSSYLSGPQVGACDTGDSVDTLAVHDLGFRIFAPNGSTELANVDLGTAGEAEVLSAFTLSSGAGTYLLEVHGDATNAAQLYDLEIGLDSAAGIFSDGFESGSTSQWK